MNPASLTPKTIRVLLALLAVLAVSNVFYSYRLTTRQQNIASVVNNHGDQLQRLSKNLDQSSAAVADLENQLAATQERLASTHSEMLKAQEVSVRQQKQVLSRWNAQVSKLEQQQSASQGAIGNLTTDVASVKSGLNSVNDQMATTRSDLQRAVGDLGVQSGLIARNSSELQELRLLGERDYYEFNLSKSKRPERVGNISIALRKADQKRQRYTINVISDDRTIEKKDKTANEPVQFYQAGFRQPTEIVVNQVSKDRIAGYVAVPKKHDSRAQTSASPAPQATMTMSRSE
jgi:chromosome segregation ATPase